MGLHFPIDKKTPGEAINEENVDAPECLEKQLWEELQMEVLGDRCKWMLEKVLLIELLILWSRDFSQ